MGCGRCVSSSRLASTSRPRYDWWRPISTTAGRQMETIGERCRTSPQRLRAEPSRGSPVLWLRGRLFALLEELRKRPLCLWSVHQVPGDYLGGSYLGARDLSGHLVSSRPWDADAATFFYYPLRLALQETAPRSDSSLQLLLRIPKDLPGFSRRFFREFYARLTPPAWSYLTTSRCARRVTVRCHRARGTFPRYQTG